MKKRITSVFLSALLIFCFFSVNVYASYYNVAGGNAETGEIGIIDTSLLDDIALEFLNDVINGDCPFLCFSHGDDLYFLRFKSQSDANFSIHPSSNSAIYDYNFYIYSPSTFDCLAFKFDNNIKKYIPVTCPMNYRYPNKDPYPDSVKFNYLGNYLCNVNLISFSVPSIDKYIYSRNLTFPNFSLPFNDRVRQWVYLRDNPGVMPKFIFDKPITPEPPPPPPPPPEPEPEPPSKPIVKPVARSSGNWYDWIVNIFVPADNYFNNKIAEINNNINKKLGGISYLYQYINSFFKTLQAPPGDKTISVTIPDNFLFKGYKGTSANLFAGATPFIRIVKAVTTSFLLVVTGIACYKKLIKLFEQ